MFTVPDKAHLKYILGACWGAQLSSPSLYLERYTVLKFALVFDLNFFHKLDLYQANETLVNLHFHCFSYSPYLQTFSALRK